MSDVEAKSSAARRTQRATKPSATRQRLRSPVDNQRSEFLRLCRARIKPSDLGLPQAQRKRTAGLRREDVAALSGVSASWYTWLEQGRDMRVSDEVLERLCQTFKLSDDERTYLFLLVQHRPPRVLHESRLEAPPEAVRMINALTIPAVVLNLRWDVLAWNAINTIIFRDYSKYPVAERNLLEILFTRPVHHISDPELFEDMARRVVARLRFDYSRCADDRKFEALVRRLSMASPLFNRLWRVPEFTLRSYGIHRWTHARYGDVAFEHNSCVLDGHPNIRVVICTPENAATQRAVAQANADLAKLAEFAPDASADQTIETPSSRAR
jgi:transcriptional regulator with XRE-family HTH domain